MKPCLAVVAAFALPVLAQTSPPMREFPQESRPLSAEALKQRIGGKMFSMKLSDGSIERAQYRESGDVYLLHQTNFSGKGARMTGAWRVEDGKICLRLVEDRTDCAEVRQEGERLFLKRPSGEVVEMIPG